MTNKTGKIATMVITFVRNGGLVLVVTAVLIIRWYLEGNNK